MRKKSLNILVLLAFCACAFTMLDNFFVNRPLFKILALGSDCLAILYAFYEVGVGYLYKTINPFLLLIYICVALNFIISSNSPRYTLLLKYFGYICFFYFGFKVASKKLLIRANSVLVYGIILIPLLVVLLFDQSPQKNQFFPNSNIFTFWGICMSLLYYITHRQTKKSFIISWTILVLYILVGTSLGIILAVLISSLFLLWKRVNKFHLFAVSIIIILAIIYIEIPVFVRIRDTFSILESLSWSDYKHIEDINLYQLQVAHSSSGRGDNASFIWRIIQWKTIFSAYIKDIIHIPFGLGADWAIANTGKPPHNDFLLILAEYGLVVFSFVIYGLIKIIKRVKINSVIFFILPIIFYHFTENLLDTFPPNIFFYFALGYYYELSCTGGNFDENFMNIR